MCKVNLFFFSPPFLASSSAIEPESVEFVSSSSDVGEPPPLGTMDIIGVTLLRAAREVLRSPLRSRADSELECWVGGGGAWSFAEEVLV